MDYKTEIIVNSKIVHSSIMESTQPKFLVRKLTHILKKYRYSVIMVMNENGLIWLYNIKTEKGKVYATRRYNRPVVANDKTLVWNVMSGNAHIIDLIK